MKASQTTGVIASKAANGLIESAEMKTTLHSGAFASVLGRFKKHYGGLWVGGRATLTKSQLSFEPNAMNRSVQTGELSVVVPLKQINDVTLEKGFVTNIIVIKTSKSALRLRCFGADDFAQRIRVVANLS